MTFRDLITEKKEKIWVVVDDSHLPNALTTDGKTWGISNFSGFSKMIKSRDEKYEKYVFTDKKAADKMAKKGDPKFGTFKVIELKRGESKLTEGYYKVYYDGSSEGSMHFKAKSEQDAVKVANKMKSKLFKAGADITFTDAEKDSLSNISVVMNESKKVTGIKGMFSKYENFHGSLPVTISIAADEDADELTNVSKIAFSGSTWALQSVDISDLYSHSAWKKAVKSAIEKMLAKDYDKFFKETDEDVWEVEKYTDFIINVPTSALK